MGVLKTHNIEDLGPPPMQSSDISNALHVYQMVIP